MEEAYSSKHPSASLDVMEMIAGTSYRSTLTSRELSQIKK